MLVVVLDTTWTPGPGDRPDLVAARGILGRVVEQVDVFDRALAAVDAWAAATRIADTLQVEGTTYWYRFREPMWRWVHERLLWRLAIAHLEQTDVIGRAYVATDEPALIDVIRAHWPAERIDITDASADARAEPPRPDRQLRGPVSRLATLLGRRSGVVMGGQSRPAQSDREAREQILRARVEVMAGGDRSRVVVLTNPGTYQLIGSDGARRQDPLFAAIIPRLADHGVDPILLATGLDQRRDDDWALVASDEGLLPQFLLRTRWSHPGDDARADAALQATNAALDATAGIPLDIEGIDLSSPFVKALWATATQVVRTDVLMLARIERFLGELRPTAILLAQEGIRGPWLIAGRRAGIPVVAVQHGVLYAGHAGYPNERHPSLCLPTVTCVYGRFERDVLVQLAYRPEEVSITGSPRLDMEDPPGGQAAENERDAIRRSLNVAEDHRMLVVSTVNLRFMQRSHLAHALATVLGAPLPNVHLVFKLHPGERDDGPYRDLLLGLARAGRYETPPITIVKDIDLYRLLRAADAHLGLLSTVLTEAVVTETPNLIAVTDAHSDLLGYVVAGVARPVRSPSDLLAALDDPQPATPAARKAFLVRHFRAGDASGRIIEEVVARRRTVGLPTGRPARTSANGLPSEVL
jgi:hypothetical protein